MNSVRRMIDGGRAALLAVLLGSSLVLSLAYSQAVPAAEASDGARPVGGKAPSAGHGPSDAKRPYAKRTSPATRSQRMSPEERRQLRRDIKDAGREIYPARR